MWIEYLWTVGEYLFLGLALVLFFFFLFPPFDDFYMDLRDGATEWRAAVFLLFLAVYCHLHLMG